MKSSGTGLWHFRSALPWPLLQNTGAGSFLEASLVVPRSAGSVPTDYSLLCFECVSARCGRTSHILRDPCIFLNKRLELRETEY